MTGTAGKPTVAVIGLGYVGLTLAVTFANAGCPVVGVELRTAVRAAIDARRAPFFEPGLDEGLAGLEPEALLALEDLGGHRVDAVVICVGTPIDPDTRTPNLEHLRSAVEAFAPQISSDVLVVVRSSVPPGTTRTLVMGILAEHGV